jgi:uncharacterized membrane protein YdjX (TVP38/TMEM64 family)
LNVFNARRTAAKDLKVRNGIMGEPTIGSRRHFWLRIFFLVLVVLTITVLAWQFGDTFNLQSLAKYEQSLKTYQQNHPLAVYFLAFVVYVVITGLSLPGAAVLTLLYGWYFGVVPAVLLVSFASTTGATFAFLLSRYLFGTAIQTRFAEQLKSFNKKLEEEGAFYLFALRLIPYVPFFVVNLVMGLTRIRVFTFWWVSQLGMLAGTVLYCYAGSQVPDLQTLADDGISAVISSDRLVPILIAFALLGLFPLAARYLVNYFLKSPVKNDNEPKPEKTSPIDNDA